MSELIATAWISLAALAGVSDPKESDIATISTVLDDWHRAAAQANEGRYFGHLAPGAVFLGTDATERWTLEEFRVFARPHFASGKGWRFVPRQRHVTLADDGATAWFDEILDSVPYGTCRGTGVLRKQQGTWLIAQYALTIPLPNELAERVVALIRGQAPDGGKASPR